MKLLSLVLSIFAASSVLAEKQIEYFCYNKNAHKHDLDLEVNILGPFVDDASAETIFSNIATWSDDKYLARYWGRSREEAKGIIVSCKEKAKSQTEAEEAIAEQERIVKERVLGEH